MKRQPRDSVSRISRREVLVAGASCVLVGPAFGQQSGQAPSGPADSVRKPGQKLRVAAINSIFRFRSHAYHIIGRLVHGLQKDGVHHQPEVQVVRMYNDQSPADDLSRRFCDRHGIELVTTPAEALGGAAGLDVDGVALIVEHGDYPANEFGQILYPRWELFQQVVEVFKKSGRSVPVFCDKHLSYDHQKAAQMVATAKTLGFGLMAGSSLPVTWRTPAVELPLETPLAEGVVTFGYDRGLAEIYLFHALETLQCMLERRKGGETGVKSVVGLKGDAVWKACDEGRISWKLVQEAIGRSPSANVGPIRENVTQPLAILIEYADGTRGAVLNLIEAVSDFCFAGRRRDGGPTVSCSFDLPAPPGARFFDPLTFYIEQLFRRGQAPYPVERTLLTSTVLELGMRSLKDGGSPATGSALAIRYAPPISSLFFRGPVADVH